MADVIDTNPQNQAPPVAPVQSPPTSLPTGSGGGLPAGGATPPTPAPSPQNTGLEVALDHVIEFGDQRLTIREALDAQKQLQRYQQMGVSEFEKAMAGDTNAAISFLQRFGVSQGPPQPSAQPMQQPQQVQPPPQPVMPPGYEDVVGFVQSMRAKEVTGGLQTLISSSPEYSALAARPNAVAEVIERLNVLGASGQPINPQVVSNVLRVMNETERAVQDRVIAPYKERLGDLGVPEPFRGGIPQVLSEPKADPSKKDFWPTFKKQIAARFQMATNQTRLAQGLASPNVL